MAPLSIAKVLLNQERLAILLAFGDKRTELSPSEVAEIAGAKVGNVAYHFKMLRQAGIIRFTRSRKVRGADEHFYVLEPGTPTAAHAAALGALMSRVAGALASVQPDAPAPVSEGPPAVPSPLARTG